MGTFSQSAGAWAISTVRNDCRRWIRNGSFNYKAAPVRAGVARRRWKNVRSPPLCLQPVGILAAFRGF